MTKVAKRGNRPVRPVGRPKGKVKETSDAQRIRTILERFGVTLETVKVKAKLAKANAKLTGKNKVKFNKALDVKIAQVRSKLRAEATGVKRKTRGRLTNAEKALVEARLEVPVTEVVEASPEVVAEVPVVEVVPVVVPEQVEAVVDIGLAEVALATEAA